MDEGIKMDDFGMVSREAASDFNTALVCHSGR